MGKRWTSNELWWLTQAWRDATENEDTKLSSEEFDEIVYERFVALAGGSNRSFKTVTAHKDILERSYDFICSFLLNKEIRGDVDWFTLSSNDQRKIMSMSGSKFLQPIEKKVFLALDSILGDGENSMSGNSIKNPSKVARTLQSSDEVDNSTSEMALLSDENDGNFKCQQVPPVSFSSMKELLQQQSRGLAEFLEKRAVERHEEYERSRQEREGDQKFWAAETAKDRALLRELFSKQ